MYSDTTGPGGISGRQGAVNMGSHNSHRLGTFIGSGRRPTIDDGELCIAVAEVTSNEVRGRGRFRQWTTPMFEVRPDAPVPAGVDGEALLLDPPLQFQI